jgi:hypothetical protein
LLWGEGGGTIQMKLRYHKVWEPDETLSAANVKVIIESEELKGGGDLHQRTGREIRNNGFTNIIKNYFGKVNI